MKRYFPQNNIYFHNKMTHYNTMFLFLAHTLVFLIYYPISFFVLVIFQVVKREPMSLKVIYPRNNTIIRMGDLFIASSYMKQQ